MEINREWATKLLYIISEDPHKFYEKFIPECTIEAVGSNLRLQPCPKCGHHDCCTATPGEVAINCFSPGCVSANHLKFLFELKGYEPELIEEVASFYGVPYYEDETQTLHSKRINAIKEVSVKFYHKQLLENSEALTYQVQRRHHTLDTLRTFLVGYSINYPTLHEALLLLGYTEEEIKEAGIWLPFGLFVYPYIDPFNKLVNRINTKNPFNVTYKDKVIQGFSTGSKTMLTTPTFNYNYVILLEGENDLMTVYEHGGESAIAVGGKLSKEQLQTLDHFLPKFERIYCMFDNDSAGKAYEDQINEAFPHLNIYHVDYGNAKDPDEAYTNGLTVQIPELLESAQIMETKGYYVNHKGSVWTIENRTQRLEFEIVDKNKMGAFVGTIRYFENNQLVGMDYDKTLAKCRFKPLNFYLIESMDAYFNDNLEQKTFDELIGIYFYTKWKSVVIRLIAQQVYDIPDVERENIVSHLKKYLGEEVTDIILKEVNELQNEQIIDYSSIPRMKLGQFFSVKNGEAFMYFTYVKKDNDTVRKLPYLISNDKQLIRLDLYKRKDEQCIILIRNKYELPVEVPNAIMDLQRISLSQFAVEEYVNGNIESRELDIKLLVRRIENFLRRYFYASDENMYKVLSLWIYGTYCYELFGQYPYLFLNGPKGSGKTILDVCIDLLAFNPKMTVSITNAALFRSISIEGGTLILDEMEALSSRNKTADSDLAAVLKGGYMRSGCAMRCDKDNGNLPQMFDVFGPKVISNIFGLEDIIGDRCIQINTTQVKSDYMKKLEDPKQLYVDGLAGVRELTSKCSLSVLENFQTIYKTYRENVFATDNARLSQILRPLQTLAYLSGPDYERAFLDFYINNVKVVKEETEYETPEGALKDILQDIAREVMGDKEMSYLVPQLHKYSNPIRFDALDGWFEVDVMHLKTFMEEVINGAIIDSKQVNTWVRRVSPVDMYPRKRRTTVSLEDENLVREYNGNTRLKVNVYKYLLTDFFSDEEIASFSKARQDIMLPPQLEDV